MKSIAYAEVEMRVRCKVCHVEFRVHCHEITSDREVVLFRATDRNYCRCGGEHTTEFQVAVTADPVNQPVMQIVPATMPRGESK